MQINILENLFHTVEKYPNKVAAIDENSEITYAELSRAATHIGTSLSEYLPEGRQESVVIFIDKSIACLKAMLGVLYSGHFYVVMDTSTPPSRFREIISTAENHLLITSPELIDKVAQLDYKGKVCLIGDLEESGRENYAAAICHDTADAPWKKRIDTDLVYVLFTSGSTGVPKGVAITHRGLIDYVDAYVPAVGIEPDDILGNQSPFFFDVSLRDIYMAQKVGATLCIIPSQFFTTPKRLLNFLEDHKVTSIAWAATAYRIVAQFKGLQKIRPSSLRKFVFCAEAMPTSVYNYWKAEYPDGVFYQQYGLTEITGACSIYKVTREFSDNETIPIGNAFVNTDLFLMDPMGNYIPPSDPNRIGEIYVRGTGVAPGYFNNREKTDEFFVQNPLHHRYPEIVYKSGDLAYWNDLQELVFSSRIDFQIKHGGHRIELGEIENGLLSVDGVEGCCCIHNRQDDEIVCFYIGDGIGKKEIMIGAQKRLPKYMIPSVYYKVDAFPLLPNGKINRRELDEKVNSIEG